MRKTKVKELKKYTVLAAAVFMMSTGISFADTTWSEISRDVNYQPSINNNKPVAIQGTVIKADSDAAISLPPVPINASTIITGTGTDGTGNAVINANNTGTSFIVETGSNVTINNVSIENTVNTGNTPVGAITNNGNLTINGTLVSKDAYSADNTSFSYNTSEANGGAIANSGFVKIDSMQFYKNSSTATQQGVDQGQGDGGAIYSNSTLSNGGLNISNSLFIENTARNYGGAIHNANGHATITDSIFKSNSVQQANSQGAAIVNSATMDISGSDFIENNSPGYGGAISNALAVSTTPGSTAAQDSDTVLTLSQSNFINNTADLGGGSLYNSSSTSAVGSDDYYSIMNINDGVVFRGNNAPMGPGGAIYNQEASPNDRAYNYHDGIININIGVDSNAKVVTFENNFASNGGAIHNEGILNVNRAVFVANKANEINGMGGAIHNIESIDNGEKPVVTISNSIFDSNTASQGGAIYNNNGTVIVKDSDFVGNEANNSSFGGAVYGAAGSTTILRADSKDMNIGNESSLVATGNGEHHKDTLAFASGANASLQAGWDNSLDKALNLNIYSNVYGNGATININDQFDTSKSEPDSTGIVRFIGDAKIQNSNIVLNAGRLSFDKDSGLGHPNDASSQLNNLTMNGGTLDLLNGQLSNHQLYVNNFTLAKDSQIELDVDLDKGIMDSLIATTTTSPSGVELVQNVNSFGDGVNPANGMLTVSGMESVTDTNAESVDILFTNAEYLSGHVALGKDAEIIEGPIYQYAVKHTSIPHVAGGGGSTSGLASGEWFNFSRLGTSDTGNTGPVAAQAAFLLMDNIYRQSFANMDMVTLMTPEQRMAWKMRNKYAYADSIHRGVYAPNVIPEERDGWYLRPFTNFENVPLKNGPRVSNVFYGTLIGGESDIIDLGKGWDGNFSFFGAYHGSHQAYNGTSIWQNGGSVGGVATAYKGNFFTGITANVGASAARATHSFGSDDFPILMTGAAWKSGYNWGLLNNKLVIQPSYMMSYTFVNVFDYTNAAGVNITQDPLHAMEFIPGIKVIGNLKNGWQPYAAVNMTWIAMDRTKFYANDVALTRLGIKPFVEYGVGLQKRTGDRFTGFGQAMFRNGGRNGVAFTLGFRWALGN